MTVAEWAVQVAVIALLGATLPMAWRLDRMLRALRADRAALDAGARELAEASRLAEAALIRLRATAELAGRQVSECVAGAEAVRDDLRYLAERSETLADRLEGAVQAARPMAGAVASSSATVRSEAERDLLRALKLP
ncbi:DUF6468 domain-containing protein [Roseococcus pinisoli]|uniref:DUF6468 domain-containing protein n=1 Tax=Roseococcus pinisoli TaxID=2835040 RepID=A0ABS5QH07_9PROT|nr:DUF6468 domain-containing protein [Roseococcus pinisoli]MBS7812621.1 hypothetical protein [Roseococcus pinisoli]